MCVFKRLKKHKAIENFNHFLFNFMPAVFCFKYLVQSLVAVPFVRQPIHNTTSEMFCQQFLITFLKFFKSFFLSLFLYYIYESTHYSKSTKQPMVAAGASPRPTIKHRCTAWSKALA